MKNKKKTNGMNKKEMLKSVLEALGHKPQEDKDGDIFIRYQMKTIYFLTEDDEEEKYVSVLLPQFYSFEEDEAIKTLTACNKLTRDLKLIKVFVDQTYGSTSASCESYYTDEDSLKNSLKHSIVIIGLVRIKFYDTLRELSSD